MQSAACQGEEMSVTRIGVRSARHVAGARVGAVVRDIVVAQNLDAGELSLRHVRMVARKNSSTDAVACRRAATVVVTQHSPRVCSATTTGPMVRRSTPSRKYHRSVPRLREHDAGDVAFAHARGT